MSSNQTLHSKTPQGTESPRRNAEALLQEASKLRDGKGSIANDVAAAARLYRQAAELGNPSAMNNLGNLLLKGEDGVAKDVAEAVRLYRKASDLGDTDAMVNLGVLLVNGKEGVVKDVREAVKLYRKAADLGNTSAMNKLGMLLRKGEDGVTKDFAEAARLYRQAADLGEESAMYNLSNLLRRGEDGVAQDAVEADRLYRQAADLGHTKAKHMLRLQLRKGENRNVVEVGETVKLCPDEAWRAITDAKKNRKRTTKKNKTNIHREHKRATKPDGDASDCGLESKHRLSKIQIAKRSTGTEGVQERQATESARDNQSTTRHTGSDIVVRQSVTSTHRRKYEAFISHAGPDKLAMAMPLYTALKFIDVHAFLDKEHLKINDCTGPEAMEHAMQEAKIGIFVLSPEFAARKWTMKELRHFLERDKKCKVEKRQRPVLLPVFFRLSLEECTHADVQVYGQDTKYKQVLCRDGFFTPERQKECSTEKAIEALKQVTKYSGVETVRVGGGKDLSSAEVMAETVKRVQEYLQGRKPLDLP